MPWSDEARAAAAQRMRSRRRDGKFAGKLRAALNRPEVREKRRAALNRPEVREKLRAAAIEQWKDPEVREKRRAALNRPEVREKRRAALNRPEVREKLRAALNRPEVREKLRAAAIEQWKDPEVREKRRAALNRPEVREKRRAALNRPEVREKLRAAAIEQWKDPEVREKRRAARLAGPKGAVVAVQARHRRARLVELWHAGVDVESIADALCISPATVRSYATQMKLGRRRRARHDSATDTAIEKLRADGVSATAIAERKGMSRNQVYAALARRKAMA